MRLLTIAFKSSAEFLSHYSESHPDGALFCRTRTELEKGEAVLMEISFQGLPNRALTRGKVLSLEAGKGAWLVFDAADQSTRDFLVRLARQEIEVTEKKERSHKRFPAQLPVDFKIEAGPKESGDLDSRAHNAVAPLITEDLGAGGVFIRSSSPPPVGTVVQMIIGGSVEDTDSFTLEGKVAWVRTEDEGEDEKQGFGVRFEHSGGEENRRLRQLLRRASERGKADFIDDDAAAGAAGEDSAEKA